MNIVDFIVLVLKGLRRSGADVAGGRLGAFRVGTGKSPPEAADRSLTTRDWQPLLDAFGVVEVHVGIACLFTLVVWLGGLLGSLLIGV